MNIVGTYEHIAGVASLAEVREVAGAAAAIVHTYLMPDRYIAMTRVAMGELLALAAGGDLTRLDRLLDAVSATPHGVAIELTPEAVLEAMDVGVPSARILQALLESESAVLRRFVDAWPGDGSRRPIAAVGGGASHPAVLQLKANLLSQPLSTLVTDEGAGIGALRLAAMATQSMSSSEASRLFPNPSVRTYYPTAEAAGPSRGMMRTPGPRSTEVLDVTRDPRLDRREARAGTRGRVALRPTAHGAAGWQHELARRGCGRRLADQGLGERWLATDGGGHAGPGPGRQRPGR